MRPGAERCFQGEAGEGRSSGAQAEGGAFCYGMLKSGDMDYFIADTHFGHARLSAQRGFPSLEAMETRLVSNWQARVQPADHVYILGDLFCHNSLPPSRYLEQLPGVKHFVIGNHDRAWMRTENLSRWFVEWGHVLEGESQGLCFTCCHYPMLDWYRRRHGAHLVYGHIHANTTDPYYPYLQTMERCHNAGVDVTGYRPVTLRELIARDRPRPDSARPQP